MTTENSIDTHDAWSMANWLRERAKANREIAGLPIDQWPHRPDVLRHWGLRFDQAAVLIEKLQRENNAFREALEYPMSAEGQEIMRTFKVTITRNAVTR